MNKETVYGLIIGIGSFLMFSMIFYYFTNPNLSLREYVSFIVRGRMAVPFLTLALLPNLLFFFIFIKLNKDDVSKGILLSTFVSGLFILVMKFI